MKIKNERKNGVAKYGYTELKKASINKSRIGGWKGKPVYSCSKFDYKVTNEAFYVIYDDGNKLVLNGYVYGTIDNTGAISECDHYAWTSPKSKSIPPAKIPKESRKTEVVVPATEYSAFINGGEGAVNVDDFFVRIDKEINELLANVGEL